MTKTMRGIIHGKTIELLQNPGLEDGYRVEVEIRPLASREEQIAALKRIAGSMADDPEFEAIMEEIQRERKAVLLPEVAG
jgi:predicted DNA-binding antitoxin AbrB/MazE fold protein